MKNLCFYLAFLFGILEHINAACSKNTFGERCAYICHCADGKSCDDKTGQCPGRTCAATWAGEYCQLGNAAYGKNAKQSSLWASRHASEAVDGSYKSKYPQCTHTKSENMPWWRVDLGTTHVLFKLKIYNRASETGCQRQKECRERLKNFKVWMSDKDSPDVSQGQLCLTHPGIVPLGGQPLLTCDKPVKGRLLFIQLFSSLKTVLTLCEVVLQAYQFGDCHPGHYGPNCNNQCQCFQNATCDVLTGACTKGCNERFTGPYCNIGIPRVALKGQPAATSISVQWPYSRPHDSIPDYGSVVRYRLLTRMSNTTSWLNSADKIVVLEQSYYFAQVTVPAVDTEYDFRIQVQCKHGTDLTWGNPGPIATFRTKCGVLKPIDPEIKTGRDLNLHWPRTAYLTVTITQDLAPCLTNFTVKYKSNTESTFLTSSSMTLTELKPYTVYTVYVHAATHDGEDGVDSLSKQVTTPEEIPGVVNDLKAEKQDDTLRITWAEPTAKNGLLRGYYVEYMLVGYGECQNVTSRCANFSFTTGLTYDLPSRDVVPFAQYDVTVRAENGDGKGKGIKVTDVFTAPAVPNKAPPTPSVINVTSHDVIVTWSQMPCQWRNGQDEMYDYHLLTTQGKIVAKGNLTDLNLTIESLKPFTGYTFKLAFRNEVGRGPLTRGLTFTTSEGVPGKVTNLKAEQGNDTLSITWDEPDVPNGNITTYHIGYKLVGYGTCENVTDGQTIEMEVSSESTNYTIPSDDLCPHCRYDVSVSAQTVAGVGKNETLEDVYTKSSVPAVPPPYPAVESVTSQNVTITWSEMPCEHQNGPDGYYQYELTNGTGEILQAGNVSGLSLLVQNLTPFTEYSFRLAFVNDVGQGPSSEDNDFTTQEGIPDTVTNLDVKAVEDTLQITWNEPAVPNGIIRRYHVDLELRGYGDCRNATDDFNTSFTTNLNYTYNSSLLCPFCRYDVTLRAETGAGIGPGVSLRDIYTAPEWPADAPPMPFASNVTSREATISWLEMPCEQRYGPVGDYHYVLESNNDTVAVGNLTDITTELNDLTPFTTYSFRLAYRNQAGQGPFTQNLEFTTKEEKPESPRSLVAMNTTATALDFVWNPPDNFFGIPHPYKMTCTPIFSYDPAVTADLDRYTVTVHPDPDATGHTVRDLKAATEYNCSLAAQTSMGFGLSTSIRAWTGPTPAENISSDRFPGVPEKQGLENTILIEIKNMSKSSKSGKIRSVRVGVEKLSSNKSKRSVQINDVSCSVLVDYMTAVENGYPCYIAAELIGYRGIFMIGDNRTYGGFYNPPLEGGRMYDVIYGVVTVSGEVSAVAYSRYGRSVKAGVRQKTIITTTREKETYVREKPVGMITGFTVSLIALVIIVAVLLILLIQSKRRQQRQPSSNYVSETELVGVDDQPRHMQFDNGLYSLRRKFLGSDV